MRLNKKIIQLQLLVFVILYFWNYLQAFTADDYTYIFYNAIHNNSLFEILQQRYLNWSGRLGADGLVLTFLNQSSLNYILPLINVINALSLLIIINFLYIYIYGKIYKVKDFLVLTLSYVTLFLLIHTFAQDFLFKTVAIQYSWGFAILAITLYKLFLEEEYCGNKYLPLFILSGIFIGLYNEIFIAFILDLYLLLFIICIFFKKSFKVYFSFNSIAFFITTLFSGAILILAPGNFVRRATYFSSNNLNINDFSIITKFLMTYVRFFRYGYHVGFAVIIVYILYYLYTNKNILPIHYVTKILFLIALLNIHIVSFLEVAYYSPVSGRMLIIEDSIMFLIVYQFALMRIMLRQNTVSKIDKIGIKLKIFAIIIVIFVTYSYCKLHAFILVRQNYIQNNINQENIKLPDYNGNVIEKYIFYFDFGRTPDNSFKRLYLENKMN